MRVNHAGRTEFGRQKIKDYAQANAPYPACTIGTSTCNLAMQGNRGAPRLPSIGPPCMAGTEMSTFKRDLPAGNGISADRKAKP